MEFRNHTTIMQENDVTLRPLKSSDWDYLTKWNKDKIVLYFTEGDDISEYSEEETRYIYTFVSQSADIFIVEYRNEIIGECWLQNMNLKDIVEQNRNKNIFRIDLMIGEKDYWNKGIGTEIIRILTRYGFEQKKADMVFGVIEDYNTRSIRAFLKNKYEEYNRVKSDNTKGKEEIRMVIRKACK